MKSTIPILFLAAVTALAACEPRPGPVELERSASDAEVVPTAITATTAFVIRPMEVTGTVTGLLEGRSINGTGEVAGAVYPDATSPPDADFLWSPVTGAVTTIPKDPISFLFGTHLNDGGTVAGTGGCAAFFQCHRAYRWTAGTTTDLLPLTGDAQSSASAVNGAGIVVGRSSTAGFPSTAVRWLADGTVQSLGRLAAGEHSRALAINDLGHIVGDADVAEGWSAPFLWTEAGGMERMVALEAAVVAVAGPGVTMGRIVPLAISESGEIAGYWAAAGTSPVRNPFFWSAVDGLVDFNTLGSFGDAISMAMNDLGEVIFTITSGDVPRELTAWVWSRDGGFMRLPALVPERTIAADINNESQIVGRSGDFQTVIWSPVTSSDDAVDLLEETLDDVLGSPPPPGADGLRAKLAQIREHIDAGRIGAARHQLDAFIHQVQAMVADGRLTEAQGAALLADAETLRMLL